VIYVFIVSAAILGLFGAVHVYSARERRALPDSVVESLKSLPEIRPGQHLVDLVLDDGRVIHRVYVAYRRWPSVSPRRIFHPYDVKRVVAARPPSPGARGPGRAGR
jgi:hypothetical protein